MLNIVEHQHQRTTGAHDREQPLDRDHRRDCGPPPPVPASVPRPDNQLEGRRELDGHAREHAETSQEQPPPAIEP
jgi:hypothetical protein